MRCGLRNVPHAVDKKHDRPRDRFQPVGDVVSACHGILIHYGTNQLSRPCRVQRRGEEVVRIDAKSLRLKRELHRAAELGIGDNDKHSMLRVQRDLLHGDGDG